MTGVRRAHARAEHRCGLLYPPNDHLRRQGAKLRRHELKCQRKAIEPTADLSDDTGVVVGDGEARDSCSDALEQQLDRRRSRDGDGVGRSRHRQRGQWQDHLAG